MLNYWGGNILNEKINEMKNILRNLNTNEMLIVLLTVSIFIHYVVATLFIVFYFSYIIYTKQLSSIVASTKYNILLFTFGFGAILLALIYQNWLGLGVALLMNMIFVITLHYKKWLTRSLFYFVVNLITILSLFVAIIGIFQYLNILADTNFIFTIHDEPELRVKSTFGNANYYANILEFVILLSLFKILIAKRYYFSKYYYSFVLFVNLFMLILTGTRSSWGALAIAIPIMFFANKDYHKVGLILLLELASVFLFIFQLDFFPRLDTFQEYFLDRVGIWITGLKGWLLHPFFGEGPLTYRLIYEQVDGVKADHAHSLYIDTLLNYGLVLTIILLIYCFSRIIAFHRHPHNLFAPLTVGLLASVLAHGVFDISIMSPQVAPLFFLLIAIVTTTKKESKYNSTGRRKIITLKQHKVVPN